MFTKVLVADRGEIAIRVIRTLDELGVGSVAVYSEPDRDAPHVRRAGEAYLLGPGPATESYLRSTRSSRSREQSGAEAIHPGYGFLAENAAFARACEEAGIVFIGPPASAIDAMGSKTKARELMRDAGVPIVPGTTDPVDTVEDAKAVIDQSDRLPGGDQGRRRGGRQGHPRLSARTSSSSWMKPATRVRRLRRVAVRVLPPMSARRRQRGAVRVPREPVRKRLWRKAPRRRALQRTSTPRIRHW